MKMITKVTDYPFMCSYQFCTIPTVQIIKCQQFKFFTIFSYLYYLIFPLFFLFCYLCGPFLLGIFKCYLSCCGHYLLAFFFLAFFLLSMLPFCFISWNTNCSAIWCVERVPVCVPLHLYFIQWGNGTAVYVYWVSTYTPPSHLFVPIFRSKDRLEFASMGGEEGRQTWPHLCAPRKVRVSVSRVRAHSAPRSVCPLLRLPYVAIFFSQSIMPPTQHPTVFRPLAESAYRPPTHTLPGSINVYAAWSNIKCIVLLLQDV
jgi:hypothetical protein